VYPNLPQFIKYAMKSLKKVIVGVCLSDRHIAPVNICEGRSKALHNSYVRNSLYNQVFKCVIKKRVSAFFNRSTSGLTYE
jgi:hypothetical protein